jgi:transposase
LAQRGHSKEKRNNLRLISLANVIDSNSYIRRTLFYPGNVNEAATLIEVIKGVELESKDIVIMDKGIATKDNLRWMNENGFKYIVASRERRRVFDPAKVTETFKSKSNHTISIYVEPTQSEMGKRKYDELFLRCHSEQQHARDLDIISKRRQKYEDGLRSLDQRCHKLVANLPLGFVMRRIGSLDSKYQVASHYKVEPVLESEEGSSGEPKVLGVRFEYNPVSMSKAESPGTYTLRTNVLDLTAREIWESYASQNDIEMGFRAMKSHLGLRPIFHHSERRILGHFLITVLAYQCMTWIMNRLRARGIRDNWKTINDCLMDVNCAMALSGDSEKAERCGALHPELQQARGYFKALGFDKSRKPVKELR